MASTAAEILIADMVLSPSSVESHYRLDRSLSVEILQRKAFGPCDLCAGNYKPSAISALAALSVSGTGLAFSQS